MPKLTFDYNEIEKRIREALYKDIGEHIAVGTEEVDNGHVFVKIVAPEFNGLSEKEKQDRVWSALEELGPDKQAVSLALAFGTDEI